MERTAILITALISLGLTGILGFFAIPFLRRLKYGQTINEIGPIWHKAKEGIPTMGGLMMIAGSAFALAVGYITLILEVPQFMSEQYDAENVRFFAGAGMALLFGVIGFIDDMRKIHQRHNLGLRAGYKLILQFVVAALYLWVMRSAGGLSTFVFIPFVGGFNLGNWYYLFALALIVGMVNAANLTDGIDGLAATMTFFVGMTFIIIATLLGYVATGLIATAIAGACVGFVLWNFNPAKVIMGDTGSLFLGGAITAMAFGVDFPLLIVLAGFVYIIEMFSVIFQVSFFKLTRKITGTGKRIFKMSPLHHHFELCGLSEIKIVIMFSAFTILGCVAAVYAVV
ncbi:MAG: phospho-N-acetylmuramoyl-pentapeptide-transferase [Oscillospiraceae bacterium]|nr:phospho-N-acetylmuramoyl-pentapeptide-transferase [Oscillospiraceae bacterium]